ncbi:MAG TPA: PIN domain-containing protein [Acidimicrobiia bacterium]
MIVLDASALLDALVRSDGHGDRARDRLEEDLDYHAPHIVKAEAISGLRKLTARGEVAEHQGSP